MVEIVKAHYRRTVVPDNVEPNMEIKKYESEAFEFEAIKTDDKETVSDLISACEREVLKQHSRLIDVRSIRRDSSGIEIELGDIETKLRAVRSKDSDAMWDEKKLLKRKVELSELLDKVK